MDRLSRSNTAVEAQLKSWKDEASGVGETVCKLITFYAYENEYMK